MVDVTAVKFGKLPPIHDARTLQLTEFTKPERPNVPPQCDWSKAADPGNWGGMLNVGKKYLNDCTIAAAGHMIQTWTANTSSEFTVSDADVLASYKAVSGYDGNEATDGGAECLTALKYWQKTGIGGHRIQSYAQLELEQSDLLKEAVYVFGGAYVGFELPLSALIQAGGPEAPATWTIAPEGTKGAGQRGSWGNHCVCIVGYTSDNFIFISWGTRLTMSLEFYGTYSDEAYVALSKDWLNENEHAPNHIDLMSLQHEVDRLQREHDKDQGAGGSPK